MFKKTLPYLAVAAYGLGLLEPVTGQIGGASIGSGPIASPVATATAQTVDYNFEAAWELPPDGLSEWFCLYRDATPDLASRYATRAAMDSECTADVQTTLTMSRSVPNGSTHYFAATGVNSSGETPFSNEVQVTVTQIAPQDTPVNVTITVTAQ